MGRSDPPLQRHKIKAVRVGGHAELPPLEYPDAHTKIQKTHQMRILFCTMVLASCCGLSVIRAADFEFEFGATLFEKTAAERSVATELGFGRRFVIEGTATCDSPLYEGLWPMTLEAFRGDPRGMRMNADATPLKIPTSQPRLYEALPIIQPVMPVAVNRPVPMLNFAGPLYDHPLYEGLWPMTIEAFRQQDEPKDIGIRTFCIAANN